MRKSTTGKGKRTCKESEAGTDQRRRENTVTLRAPCNASIIGVRNLLWERGGGMKSTCLTPEKGGCVSNLSVGPFYSTELCFCTISLYETGFGNFKTLLCIYKLMGGLVYFWNCFSLILWIIVWRSLPI